MATRKVGQVKKRKKFGDQSWMHFPLQKKIITKFLLFAVYKYINEFPPEDRIVGLVDLAIYISFFHIILDGPNEPSTNAYDADATTTTTTATTDDVATAATAAANVDATATSSATKCK